MCLEEVEEETWIVFSSSENCLCLPSAFTRTRPGARRENRLPCGRNCCSSSTVATTFSVCFRAIPKAPIGSLRFVKIGKKSAGLGGFVVGEPLKKVGIPLPSDLKMMPLLLSLPRSTMFYVFCRGSPKTPIGSLSIRKNGREGWSSGWVRSGRPIPL